MKKHDREESFLERSLKAEIDEDRQQFIKEMNEVRRLVVLKEDQEASERLGWLIVIWGEMMGGKSFYQALQDNPFIAARIFKHG